MSDYSEAFKKIRSGDEDVVLELKKVESNLLGSTPGLATILKNSQSISSEARLHRIDMMKFAGEVLKQSKKKNMQNRGHVRNSTTTMAAVGMIP